MTEFKDGLKQFYGTEMYHKLNNLDVYATDGVAYFCENAECYWLFDLMCTFAYKYQNEQFIVVEAIVADGGDELNNATINVEDGNENKLNKATTKTDMPIGEWKFFISNYPDKVIMLPSEY